MNILTDEEIEGIKADQRDQLVDLDVLRAVEDAVLSKLAERVSLEPVAYVVLEGRDTADSGWGYIAAWPEACHEHINEAIVEYEVEGAGDWKVVPLYTEAQLIAAQQRTAEACAKLAASAYANGSMRFTHRDEILEALSNGEWREYL